MKKIFLAMLVMGLLSHTALAAGINMMVEDDFEQTTVTDGKVYIESKDEFALTTSNSGIAKAEILTVADSKALRFTGRTDTGSSIFTITFPQAYTEEAYPDTKLVVMFDENLETAVSNSYAHMQIVGVSEADEAKNAVQMFRFAPADTKFATYRANNAGTVIEAKNNQPATHIYIIDLAEDKFDWCYDTNKSTGLSFQNSAKLKEVNSIKFNYQAKETISLDNIRVFAVPNNFVFEVSGENVTNMPVNGDFAFKASNYISDTALSGITVMKEGSVLEASEYEINQKYSENGVEVTVDFAENLDYESQYTITVPANTEDILGNLTAKAKTFYITTDKKINFAQECTYEVTDTAILFNTTVKNNGAEECKAYVIARLYDADGILKKYSYIAKVFEVDEEQTFKGGFGKIDGGTVKFDVLEALK